MVYSAPAFSAGRQRRNNFALNQPAYSPFNGNAGGYPAAHQQRDFPALSQSSGDYSGITGGGGYSSASAPYLPPGFQAPSPDYIRGIGQAQTQNELNQRRVMDNYSRNQQLQAMPGAFAAAKSMGQSDSDARRAAYIYGHGGAQAPFVPQPFGQVGQEQQQSPAMYAPPAGASGIKPPALGAQASMYNALRGQRQVDKFITDPNDKDQKKQVLMHVQEQDRTPDQAMKTLDERMAMYGGGAPTTQPSAPTSYPMSAQSNNYLPAGVGAPGNAYGGASAIQVTTQQAQTIFDSLRTAYPHAQDADLEQKFHESMAHYGVNRDHSNALLGSFRQYQGGGLAAPYAPAPPATVQQVIPGRETPLSMLGPSNGMDPSQNYAAPRQAAAGLAVRGNPSVRTTTAPAREGYTKVKDWAPEQQQAQYDPTMNISQQQPTTQPTTQPAQPQVQQAVTGADGRTWKFSGQYRDGKPLYQPG